jgi:prepilin-type N-terminal cleavage/methylation domain-containing protein
MKRTQSNKGFTLLEMTVVLSVLLTLIGTGLFVSRQYGNWQLGRAAAENLRTVHAAQRMFLADNPTTLVANITAAQIIPYLPNQATAIPTVRALTGVTMTIRVNVNPPNINNGSGGIYDPSGSSNDSLWDVGL